MNPRSVRAGLIGAVGLAGFYTVVVGWVSGVDHLAGQARADWYYLAAIIAGFGIQVALLAELRRRRAGHGVAQVAGGTGAGASGVGMVACCAHHLADLAPIVGVSGAAAFLTDHRVAFMVAGITVNAAGIILAARRLRRERQPSPPGGVLCPAA